MTLVTTTSWAAQKDHYQYKVESDTPSQKTRQKDSYHFDSLEAHSRRKSFRSVGYWPKAPNFSIGGGFLFDEEVIDGDSANRFFLSSEFTFRNRSWHRFAANGLLLQNNSFYLGASWQFTPSRKPFRSFYSLGLSHKIFSDEEFRSLLKVNHFFLNVGYGFEMLTSRNRGLRGEAKLYWGSGTYALHLMVNYIFHL